MKDKKILIVDDDKNVALMLQNYFESLKITSHIAVDLQGVLDLLNQFLFDLIFLDYRMSPHTGKDILERLKIMGNTVPVIMMSAYKRNETAYEMKRLGASEYIGKPYNFEEIDRILKNYLLKPKTD
ncbi:response regulator [bacterium]|nr:response regulator [bacterium]MCP5462548.1 response regulator [bacterium]